MCALAFALYRVQAVRQLAPQVEPATIPVPDASPSFRAGEAAAS